MRYQNRLTRYTYTVIDAVFAQASDSYGHNHDSDLRGRLENTRRYIRNDYNRPFHELLSAASPEDKATIRFFLPAVSDMMHMAMTASGRHVGVQVSRNPSAQATGWGRYSVTALEHDPDANYSQANLWHHWVRSTELAAENLTTQTDTLGMIEAWLAPLVPEGVLASIAQIGDRFYVNAEPHPDTVPQNQQRYLDSARTRVMILDASRGNGGRTSNLLPSGITANYSVIRDIPANLRRVPRLPAANEFADALAAVPASLAGARDRYVRGLRAAFEARRAGSTPQVDESAERERRRQQSQERYRAFRNSVQASSEKVIPTLPFVGHGLASSRRWGIEIETGAGRAPLATPAGWERKGDGSLRSAYDGYTEVEEFEPYEGEVTEQIRARDCSQVHDMVERYDSDRDVYYMLAPDGYVRPDTCTECGTVTRIRLIEPQTIRHQAQNDDCAEFVSPILTSMHSNGLESLLAGLAGRPTTSSAGVHVHVEARDLTPVQLASLLLGYDRIENLIDSSYQRERRDFCRLRDVSELLDIVRTAHDGGEIRHGERYVTVNLQSLRRHGTVEFRAMGPVYDYDYLVRWAMFCREMVNLASAGVTPSEWNRVSKWSDLLALFAKYGKEYLRAVIHEMGGEVPESPTLERAPKGTHITDGIPSLTAENIDQITQAFRGLTGSVEQLNTRLVGALTATATEV